MDARRKKLVIIGGILLSVLLVGTVTILILKSHSGDLFCLPTDEVPQFDPERIKNVAAADNKSLVGSFAYLELANGDDGDTADQMYSQLSHIGSVTVDLDAKNRQRLNMNEPCSQIVFKFDRTGQTNHIWSIKVAPSDKNPTTRACATRDTGIYFGENEGYNCFSKLKFPCYELKQDPKEPHEDELSNKKMGDLVFEALRFEIDGDPKQIAKGRFSKPPHYCF